MTTTHTPFIVRITKNLHWAEKAFVIALAIGTVLAYSKIDSSALNVSLIGLAVPFLLYAYKPLDIVRDENEPLKFSEIFALTILPKVMWISSAVSTLGLLFYMLELGNDGYMKMLMIGGLIIGIAVVILTIFLASGVENLKSVTPILLTAVPLLFIDSYILFK